MKVTTLTHAAIPSHSTNTEQTIWSFTELARLGVEVDVICRGHRANGRCLRAEVSDFYGVPSMPHTIDFIPTGSGWGRGAVGEGLADLRNFLRARRAGAGLVHTRDIFALTLALALGLRCVFEAYRVDFNRDRRFALWRSWCYRHHNLLGIVTHSELSRRSFLEARVPASRAITIYNGYPSAHFERLLSREEARAKLGLDPDSDLVVYTGHVDPAKGVEMLARLALKVPETTFLLVGSMPGSEAEARVVRTIENIGARNVRLLPRVAQSVLPAYLFAADCLIIPPTAAPLRLHGRTVLPMKTFSYLAAGRPIIAGNLPDLREILNAGKNALLVAPDDLEAAAAAVRWVLSDRDMAERLGEQARRDARAYTWQARARKLADFFTTVCVGS